MVEQCGLQSLRQVVAGSFQKGCADFWFRSRKVIPGRERKGGGEGRKRKGVGSRLGSSVWKPGKA